MPTLSARRRKPKLSPDHVALLSAFNEHNVKYLVVGGYAVGFHSEPRATKDLDIYIRVDEENSHAVFRALASFGAPLSGLSTADFRDGKSFFIMGFPPERILEIPVISAKHLIANKLAAGRPRDLLDVEDILEAQLEAQTKDGTTEIIVKGWNVGFKKIACTKLLRTELGLGLSEAKHITDAIVANRTVPLGISSLRAAKFISKLKELGAKTVTTSATDLP